MKSALFITMLFLLLSQPGLKFHFGENLQGKDWVIINDGVMGGKSDSSISLDKDKITFTGNISLENNGGFASLRSPIGSYDLSDFTKVIIKFRSYGRSFSLMLESSLIYYKPVFKYDFKSENEEWEEWEIDISEFKEFRLSEFTGNKARADALKDILRIGIILYDKQEGPFKLEIKKLEFL